MHEIITLQLGQRSNFVATHFWNAQESYFTYSENEVSPVDHNIHFRPGIGADGSETFTPRTVIYDLKGGFGSLRKYNALYELEEQQPGSTSGLWEGNPVLRQQPKITQNEYQKKLELGLPPPKLTSDAVRYWSDFNRVFYHPKSIVQLNEYDLDSQLRPFEDWSLGQSLFSDLDKEHDLFDRDLRPFIEECDQLKGFQIFSGVDDAWGGFAARYVDELRDELGSKSIWVWALNSAEKPQREKQRLASANIARSLGEISSQVSAYIPISESPGRKPDYLRANLAHEWYSSALTALAIESVGLPTRLRGHESLDIWATGGDPRNIYNLQASIGPEKSTSGPTMARGEKKEDSNNEEDYDQMQQRLKDFDVDLSPIGLAAEDDVRVFNQISVTRNSTDEKSTTNDTLMSPGYMRSQMGNVGVQSFYTGLEFPIVDSFPHDLIHHQSPPDSTIKTHTALSMSSQVGKYLTELQQTARRFIPLDEREELSNNLTAISETYRDRWESDLDSDDD